MRTAGETHVASSTGTPWQLLARPRTESPFRMTFHTLFLKTLV
jgi:hypothetical protein